MNKERIENKREFVYACEHVYGNIYRGLDLESEQHVIISLGHYEDTGMKYKDTTILKANWIHHRSLDRILKEKGK